MKYIALPLALAVAGCSLPSAVSDGFSEISNEFEKNQKIAEQKRIIDNKYEIDTDSNRALVAFTKGNLDIAQEYATSALQQNPADPYALMVMAVINDTLGMPNKAGFYYQAVVDARDTEPTSLGNYRLNLPQSLYESAYSRLKVIDLKQAPFVVNIPQTPNTAPVFEIKEVYMTADETPAKAMSGEYKTGMDLFSDTQRNVISRFLTLKTLAEKGYITKEEFITRRKANIGGLLPLTKPRPAKTVGLPVPTTDAIIDRFNSMKNAYELKSMNANEYITERDVILEALLPTTSIEKLNAPAVPTNLLEGADEVRKLDVLIGFELITKNELDAEKTAIETVLRMGGKPLPTKTTPDKAVVDKKSNVPMPLIPAKK